MAYKRILTIQDISCIGQCSMTVALPILSVCGHECCVLPTAILSTHTGGFGKPAVHHLTGSLKAIVEHWRSQDILFDAILVGYLGSMEAIDCASEILDSLLAPGGLSIVDPAMADHGKLYSGLDDAYARAMKTLCDKADVMLPNITEAAMMSGVPYRETFDENYVRELLSNLGGKTVVLTGVGYNEAQTGASIRSDSGIEFCFHNRVGKNFHGTGDIFAASFTGSLMQGKELKEAVQIASAYTRRCIETTISSPAHWYGIKFESELPWLITQLK